MKELFSGIDQGTSGTKGVLLNERGEEVYEALIPIGRNEKKGGIVEQDPAEVLTSVKSLLLELKNKADKEGYFLKRFGLSTQRSGVLAWDKKGNNLTPLITWADLRFEKTIDALGEAANVVSNLSCLPPHPGFAATKISNLQSEFPSKDIFIGTLDSFLIYNLLESKPFVTDDSMASRTLLYNPRSHDYDDELLKIFKVEKSRLAKIVPTLGVLGEFEGVALTASIGDQQSSLIGRRNKDRNSLLNLGSIFSLLVDTKDELRVKSGFSSNVLFSSLDRSSTKRFSHTLEGTSPASSGVVKWVKDLLGLKDSSSLDNLVGSAVTEDKTFAVCYFPKGGSGSPDWRKESPPKIINWNGEDKKAIAKAALENIGGFVIENIEALIPKGQNSLMVSGGLSKSRYLLQFIADASGKILLKSDSPNASARGAALLSSGDTEGERNEGLKFEAISPKRSSAINRLASWRELKTSCKE